jgi:hypothetical protein
MNRGVVEQIGSPSEIYNFPKTLFVASFVGNLNKLDCTVLDADHGKVGYNGTVISTGARLSDPIGSTVTLMLRPEELQLGTGGGENRLSGRIEAVNFLGAIARIMLNLDGTQVAVDVFNERQLELPRAGQPHTVSFPSHACWVMEQMNHVKRQNPIYARPVTTSLTVKRAMLRTILVRVMLNSSRSSKHSLSPVELGSCKRITSDFEAQGG